MPRSDASPRSDDHPEQSPVAWFTVLVIASNRGDFGRALEAQRELSRLGWSVVRKQAKGPGGAR